MRKSIAILGCVLLGLATALSLEPSHCGVDLRLTPSDDVLAGTNTPVFFFRSPKNSVLGHTLIRQENAMADLKRESTIFKESGDGRIDIDDECPESESWGWNLNSPMKCVSLSTIYPKILVIVDHGIYQRYAKKSNKLTKLLEHVLAFWNGVDLNFRTLERPKMRLNIAGIVIEKHVDELPFLFQKAKDGRLHFSSNFHSLFQFLESDGSYWSDHFGRYDIVAVMTSKPVYSKIPDVDTIVGASYHSMCEKRINGPPQRVLVADDGSWLKIRAVSEFLAMSFQSSVTDSTDAACPKNESAVMNYNSDVTKNLPDWSKCFLDSFKMRFNTRQAECLYEKPEITSPLPRIMPGQILDCDGQCESEGRTKCCMNESICQDLMCKNSETSDSCAPIGIHAADGTTCGDEKICFRRKCVFNKNVK